MTATAAGPQTPELTCLIALAAVLRISVDADELAERYGVSARLPSETAAQQLQRAASSLDLTSKLVAIDEKQLARMPLPLIAFTTEQQPLLVLRRRSEPGDNATTLLVRYAADSTVRAVSASALAATLSGTALLAQRKPAAQHRWSAQFGISWFLTPILKYRKVFTEVIVAAFFLQLFALITPLFFQLVMDKVLVHQGITTLNVLAIGLLLVLLFDAIVGGLRHYLFTHTASRIDVELGARLFRHLTQLPLSWFESRQTGQSAAHVQELNTIRQFITGSALTLLIDLFFTLVFFLVMWLYSPELTLLVLATLPLYIALAMLITPLLRKRLDEKFQHGAANQAFLTESIGGIETIKSQAAEKPLQRQWEDQLAGYVDASFKAQNLSNICTQIAGFFSKLTTLLIIWLGAHRVMDGSLTVGQLIAFNMIASRVTGPIIKLSQLWQDFQQAGNAIKRLGDIFNSPIETTTSGEAAPATRINGAITFEDVSFRYKTDATAALQQISLTINPGEVIGVVGRSGSGKSTLGKLIQRLYVPQSGRILIDNTDISRVSSHWLRRQTGVVQQRSFLFRSSIRDNIALGRPSTPLAAIVSAAQLAGADQFIRELPRGYDTLLEECGANLSGGQRQRIAIARALLHQPRLLILDEATSALDYESERAIQSQMHGICSGRTVIIIAHRLTTVRHADRILVLDQGRIIETGDHTSLLQHNGYYARLHRYQSESPPIRQPALAA